MTHLNKAVIIIASLAPCFAAAQTIDTMKAIPLQELKEVEVLSGYKKYVQDSVRSYTIYRKNIKDAERKLTVLPQWEAVRQGQIGIYMPGAVSELADRLSGQKKKDKCLRKEIQTNLLDKFMAIRYNVAVINSITALDSASSQVFILAYPMEESFARMASNLELKMWIRYNYKLWMNKPADSLQMQTAPKR